MAAFPRYTPEEEHHRRLILEVYEQVLKPLDSSRVDEFFASDYVQHSPLAATGAAGLKAFLDWAKANSPAATHEVKRLFVDGDYVVAHVHVVIRPGDRGNAVVDIFRISAGKVAEHWDVAQAIPEALLHANGVL
ncbi:MAG TPA: nuclear transport factor 2 family protein [Steroidobacteraceae bacterium]|nr:nuclear transport factor 2 family protein [Steroidobacteraceae bacterium]